MTATRIAELEERVCQLKTELAVEPDRLRVARLQIGLRITHHQALLLVALYDGRTWMSAERLDLALPDRGDARDLKTIKVQIHHLRKALGDDAILCYVGVGYTLGAAGVKACKRVLAAAGG